MPAKIVHIMFCDSLSTMIQKKKSPGGKKRWKWWWRIVSCWLCQQN